MASQVNQVTFFKNKNFLSTTEKTSESGVFSGVEGEILYMLSDTESGIYKVDIRLFNDSTNWYEVAEGTIEANDLFTLDFDFFIPEMRVRFTPDVAPTTFTAVAYGYPAVFKRGKGDPVC